jgi:hypothetical protein
MSGPSHKLYVDESGTKEYAQSYPRPGGVTPYFVFAGLLVDQGEASKLLNRVISLKEQVFKVRGVEVKANWLKRPDERKVRYLDPYGLTNQDLDALVVKLYAELASFDGQIIATIVDKAAVQKAYKDYPSIWYAPAIAYDCLMQRVQLEMVGNGGSVSTTIDDMDGATPNGNQYRDNLSKHHRSLRASGSKLDKGAPMDRLADMGFSNSQADERLQLADLAAHAVYKQFVEYGEAWDQVGLERLPTYDYFGRISAKFRQRSDGLISGWGIVKFPRTAGVSWRFEEP